MISSKIILIKLRIYTLLELFGDFLSKYTITNFKVQKNGVKSAVLLSVDRFFLYFFPD